jgi:glycogen synthase
VSGLRVLAVGSMYPPHHLGGAELIWHSSMEHLRASRCAVRILASDYRSEDPDPAFADSLDVHRDLRWYWRDHRFPRLPVRERLRIERHNLATIDRHLGEHRPDVVSWWSMGGMSLAPLARVREREVPAVGVLLDDWLVYGPRVDGWLRLWRRAGPLASLARPLTGVPGRVDLDRAARWIFMSETVRRHAREAGVTAPDSIVLHRGIDRERFEPRPDREWAGRLLYLGRIDPRKGIEVAIRALAQLPECTLRVVGDGDRRHLTALRELAADLGVGARVAFERVTGDAVPAVLADADALLFPVLWEEPWGLVPLEAMAAGTPVVASGTGGSGEYLEDGANALLYAPREDPAKLAGAIGRLAADPSLRRRLREGGSETLGRFSERSFNEGVQATLEEAAR